jgi:hypothetical protein
MKQDRAGLAIPAGDQRARVIPEQRARHAPKMDKRRGDALAPVVLPLAEKRFDEEPSTSPRLE